MWYVGKYAVTQEDKEYLVNWAGPFILQIQAALFAEAWFKQDPWKVYKVVPEHILAKEEAGMALDKPELEV